MGNSQPILVTHPGKPKREAKPGPNVGRLALVAGIFIIITGWVDILVGWFPLGFGSPEWEFGAVSVPHKGAFGGTGLAVPYPEGRESVTEYIVRFNNRVEFWIEMEPGHTFGTEFTDSHSRREVSTVKFEALSAEAQTAVKKWWESRRSSFGDGRRD